MNVKKAHLKFQVCILNIKRDIHVQKVKVKKLAFKFTNQQYKHDLYMLNMREWTENRLLIDTLELKTVV